tara:strand:+ start:744 stop:1151 length:408 start_codon:yes stop_codon:yes gene_type:complete
VKLAVYGTLRNGRKDVGKVEGFSLVFPGTLSYPALIKNEKGKGAIVELMEVEDEDLSMYDRYENVDGGLYIRTTVEVTLPNEEKEKAWIYVAGPLLWQKSSSFTEVPDQDWFSHKTGLLIDRVYEQDYQKEKRFI